MQKYVSQNEDQATGAVASFCFLLPVLVETARANDKKWVEAWSQHRINKFNLLKCRSHCFTIGSQVTADELATKLSWVSSLISLYRTVAYHWLGHWVRKTLPFLFFTCVSTQCSVELSSERFCLLERKRSWHIWKSQQATAKRHLEPHLHSLSSQSKTDFSAKPQDVYWGQFIFKLFNKIIKSMVSWTQALVMTHKMYEKCIPGYCWTSSFPNMS